MNSKEFRDEVYKKYEYYKKYNVKRKNSFYTRNQYHSSSLKLTFNCLATFSLICIIVSGVVYATSQYIKNVKEKNIWKEPEQYYYEKEKNVTEKDISQVISEEQAKEIGLEILQKLKQDNGVITNIYLNKFPALNQITWVMKTNNDLEVTINARTGQIEGFHNNKIFDQKRALATEEEAKEKAKELYQEIHKELNFEGNYELAYIYSMGQGKWSADFSIKYNDIFNDYQTIRFIFFPATKELVLLRIFDYEFENNPFEITEEEAIKIAKVAFGERNIKDIFTKKDIKLMNAMVYMKENPPTTDYSYRTENIVRNIWNIEIVDQNTGFSETYYVDATTGEVIGGTESKSIHF